MEKHMLETATQVEFNGWLLNQLGGDSDFDDILTIIERIVKIIGIVKKIIEIIFIVTIPTGSTLEGDLEGSDSEYLIALTDAIEKGYVHFNVYSKAEVDALISQNISSQGGTYSNLFVFSNPQNQISGLLTSSSLSLDNKTVTTISTAGSSDNDKLATKGYVDNTIVSDLATSLANYVSLAGNQTISGAKTMTGNNVITASSLTLDNKTVSTISTAGNSNNDTLTTKGYVDTAIANVTPDLSPYFTKTEILALMYPIGSYFLYETEINIDSTTHKPTTTTNTILDYFEWEVMNPNDSCVLGLARSRGALAGFTGSHSIEVRHLPPHSHKGLTPFNSWSDYGAGFAYATNGWGGSPTLTVNDIFLKQTVGTVDSTTNTYTENASQSNFIPAGYYLFCYKRIA